MRMLIAACGLALLSIGPVLAGQPNPPVATPALEPYSTTDTPIGALLDDPAARAILEKLMPQIAQAPRAIVNGSSLKALQGYSAGTVTNASLRAVDAELAALGPRPVPRPVPGAVNVNEARVRPYVLPDPLKLADGSPVRDARTWWRVRRPVILSMFENQQYGRAPPRPAAQRFEVFDKRSPAFSGKAVRTQVLIHLSSDPEAPRIHLVQYVPAKARGPVPMLLIAGFAPPANIFGDPGARPGMVWNAQAKAKVAAPPVTSASIDVERFLAAGFGIAAFYYGDVDPDFVGGYPLGIRAHLSRQDEASRAPHAWGSIAAWGWAMSRIQDYFETDRTIDAKHVAIHGASRLGKTVLWAAARDQRFAAVIACCSGEGGASLSKRNFGETLFGQTAGAPYQFAPNWRKYADNEAALPMDSHMLLALIAPRPVLLQTGSDDHAADPKGEFLAQVAAGPVYRLLGKSDLGASRWPPQGPILNHLGYTCMTGDTGSSPLTGTSTWRFYKSTSPHEG